jgi:proton-translocating NADH-quinone oxidoreductase chain M
MGVLTILGILPLLAMGGLFFIDSSYQRLLSKYSLLVSLLILNYSIAFLYGNFDSSIVGFQFFESYSWVKSLNLNYTIGLDAISLWFIILTNFLILLCVWLASETVYTYSKWFYFVLFLTQFFLIQVFLILELALFYIAFEAVLIPMFLLIMIWGSRERKIHAAYQFFLYTLIGSFLFLLALFLVYSIVGSTDYLVLLGSEISNFHQLLLGVALFIAFAIKIPLFPVHIWLPEAHVEAPTSGSVLLAGIMLKMGGYGLLRFFLPLCPYCVDVISSVVFTICIVGVFYTAFTTLRQIDMKKIIAYSSVGHMCFVVAGLLAGNIEAIEGSIYLMLTHGIVSPALFLCVGVIYDRYGSRLFSYYGGLTLIMPIYAIFFYLFILANFSLPGTASFIAEILVVIGLVLSDIWVASLLFLSGTIGLAYSLWLINRVVSGSLSAYVYNYIDLTKTEFIYMSSLASLTLFLGICPTYVLETLHIAVSSILLI